MKNKKIYLASILKTMIISIFLLVIIIKNPDTISRLILFPFLFCSIFTIGKNVCFLKEKKREANIFRKLYIFSFLIFWFGFLVIWSYSFIRNHSYFSLVLTIPFWIAGIYIGYKFLFDIPSKQIKKNPPKFSFPMIVSSFLIVTVLAIGIVCLFWGIYDIYQLKVKTKDYLETTGYFKDYQIYRTDKDSTTYQLIYTYHIDGVEYTLTTDYGVGYIPKENSQRKIKYNANNPRKAVLVGTNKSKILIYFGSFFLLGGLIFVLSVLQIKGVFDKIKRNVLGIYAGFVSFIIGIGIFSFQMETIGSFLETIKIMGIWLLIPVLFMIVGLFQMIKCILKDHKNL